MAAPQIWSGWQTALLRTLKAPVTKENVQWLSAWAALEGGGQSFNPLNTKQPAPGAKPNPNNGVMEYPTAAAGIAATAKTLENGRYPAIVAALHSGDPQTYTFTKANDQGRTNNPLVAELATWGSKTFAGAVQANEVHDTTTSTQNPTTAALTAGGTAQAVGGALTGALTGWVGDITGWVQGEAGYAFTWLGLVLFAVVLGILGLLKLLGVQPGALLRDGTKTAEAAA